MHGGEKNRKRTAKNKPGREKGRRAVKVDGSLLVGNYLEPVLRKRARSAADVTDTP